MPPKKKPIKRLRRVPNFAHVAFFGPAPGAAAKPTKDQVLNFVINAVAACSGFNASHLTKDWVLGDTLTDPAGHKHPGAGLSQHAIDTCLNPKLNALITHFGSARTVTAGTYGPTSTLGDVADDVHGRI